jgi:chromosome partitioning protein
MKLAMMNIKGGVGKTTTAVNLAACFAASGHGVLVVDLDPQASATHSFGIQRSDAEPSVAEILSGKVPAGQAIWDTGIEGVDLLPGSVRLASCDLVLARRKTPERGLAKALAPISRHYQIILMDCPPGLSILTLNALAAADAFLVPVVPHPLNVDALAALFEALEEVRGRIGRVPELLGILPTMVDRRTAVTERVLSDLRGVYGTSVLQAEIPINVRLAEAPERSRTIFHYESWSKGAHAYGRLGEELLRRARDRGLLAQGAAP